MKESDTNREIIQSINAIPNSWCWKIPDSSPMNRATQRYIPARAFDIAACVNGQFYAVEGKLVKSLGGLSVNAITEFEKRCLAGVARAGGAAILAIAYRVQGVSAGQMKKHGLKSANVRELLLVKWDDWEQLELRLPEGVATVPRQEIVEAAVSVEWVGKGRWDLEGPLYDLHEGAERSGWQLGMGYGEWVPFEASLKGRPEAKD